MQTLIIYFVGAAHFHLSSTVNGIKGRLFGEFEVREYTDLLGDHEFVIFAAIISTAIAILQLLILLPVRKPRPRLNRGWPLWLAITAAGACGAMLASGIVMAGFGLPTALGTREPEARVVQWTLVCVVLISWLAVTPLIMAFVRKRLDAGQSHDLVLRRLSALLFKGTVIEAVLIIPLDVMVRRKTDCYCGTGTFWALTVCIGVGIITLGPIVLLPVFARRNKPWFKHHCDACGYDLSGLPAPKGESPPRCPECGAGWRI